MAKRRMFSSDIIATDEFLDMSLSAQALYMHLNMNADDDGFISNPRTIMRMIGVAQDDMKVLLSKKFVLSFDERVCAIKHWRINNQLRSDRYTETKYTNYKSQLFIRENGAYSFTDDERALSIPKGYFSSGDLEWQPYGNHTATTRHHSIGKVSKDKVSKDKERERFQKPSLEDVKILFTEKNYEHLSDRFYNYYESNGWKIGKNKMVSWRSAVAQWVAREKPEVNSKLKSKYANI